jgi:hypothetical protein
MAQAQGRRASDSSDTIITIAPITNKPQTARRETAAATAVRRRRRAHEELVTWREDKHADTV